jgi:hypothetical protein
MGRKSILEPYAILVGGDMSADVTGPETSVKNLDQITYEIVWSGTSPIGTIEVQTLVKDVWQAIALPTIGVSGATGNHLITINSASHFHKLRVKYVRTSGTGLITINIIGAVLGA